MKYALVMATIAAIALALSCPSRRTVSTSTLKTAKLTNRLMTPMVPNFASSWVNACQRWGGSSSRRTPPPYAVELEREHRIGQPIWSLIGHDSVRHVCPSRSGQAGDEDGRKTNRR